MAALQISDELSRGLTVEKYLQSAVLRERTLANRRQIEEEQVWWLNLPLDKRARYEGRFIAVHNKQVVDSDEDEDALHKRIRAKYGNMPVLIMPAEGPREIRVFSPRLVRS
jgi:hypothetical protein